jgi:hypothetical protein
MSGIECECLPESSWNGVWYGAVSLYRSVLRLTLAFNINEEKG